MFNYKCIVSYNGSNYHGWAKQNNQVTIQGTIEEKISTILNKKVNIIGAGRTDAYVHANNQVFNFRIEKKLNIKQFLNSLNKMLPNDIIVKKMCLISLNFHATHSSLHKTYIYFITTKKNVFNKDLMYFFNYDIDVKKLKHISKLFLGQHNFLSFSTSELENTIRVINFIRIRKVDNCVYKISVDGNGFLRNMVRMLVGAMLDYLINKKSEVDIIELLNNPKKGSSITKVEGRGLYLDKVYY
ncbi:MAG: tRNA pseudouridine(38-40) synthase TruA [Mycoplasmataceae bacterium]|jgi:tRNA pseudouridine38-40 synthase|nr:tRNA pseudouridine(38-40) synthase TruA [Mycoplasmataceae bacterium]